MEIVEDQDTLFGTWDASVSQRSSEEIENERGKVIKKYLE